MFSHSIQFQTLILPRLELHSEEHYTRFCRLFTLLYVVDYLWCLVLATERRLFKILCTDILFLSSQNHENCAETNNVIKQNFSQCIIGILLVDIKKLTRMKSLIRFWLIILLTSQSPSMQDTTLTKLIRLKNKAFRLEIVRK